MYDLSVCKNDSCKDESLNYQSVIEIPNQLIAKLNLSILGFLFVELVVATPVEWRTFVSVVCTATKSKLGLISFQNIRVMYMKTVQKHKTGQKTE